MNYQEALQIARENPGCRVRRSAAGVFEVVRPDGSVLPDVIAVGGVPAAGATPPRDLQHQYDGALAKLETARREIQMLQGAIHRLERENAKLQVSINGLQNRAHKMQELMAARRKQHDAKERERSNRAARVSQLESKLARVSPEELQRIEAAEQEEFALNARNLSNQRREIVCRCRGENEGCVHCFGRGVYTTDGHGHEV